MEQVTEKSVQSTLSHLQSPPERMQSQRNYGSFLWKDIFMARPMARSYKQSLPKITQ